MSEYKDMNLYEKIQAVSDEIKNIEKKTEVRVTQTNSYKAVADIDVLLAVKKAERKYGLVSIPVKQELIRTDQVQKVKQGYTTVDFVDIVKMTLRIINIDKPDETVEVESFGRGLDSGDKGFGKASTYARKYALLNAYKIATGEDPDEQASQQIAVLTVDDRKNIVINYMLTNAEYGQQVLQHFALGDANEMSTAQINTVYNNLSKKGLV